MLAEALTLVNKNGERDYEAELYRVKGELTLQKSGVRGPASEVPERLRAKGKRQKKLSVVSSQLSVPNTQPLTPNTRAAVEQEAEECFHKALAIARQQRAKLLELRAVMSLVRLRQQSTHATRNTQHATRNKLDDAHRLLAEVYHWFTEGFETQDLQDAKALLDALG